MNNAPWKADARVEALKLAVRPGLDKEAILATADDYFAFIVKDEAQPAKPEKKS